MIILLNLAVAGLGIYVCYRLIKAAQKAGKTIKKSLNYWTSAAMTFGNMAAVIAQIIIAAN